MYAIKRVPMDFGWPLDTEWIGYQSPLSVDPPRNAVVTPLADDQELVWEYNEPPEGDGYQLWDLFAPISPVFATRDDLSEWMGSNGFSKYICEAIRLDGVVIFSSIHRERGESEAK